MHRTCRTLLLPLLLLLSGGCGWGGSDESAVELSWEANRESGVNSAGGGYRVYYSRNAGFDLDDARVKDVAYEGGPTAPTAATLKLHSGTWFIRVAAYSALNPEGSVPSSEITVSVP